MSQAFDVCADRTVSGHPANILIGHDIVYDLLVGHLCPGAGVLVGEEYVGVIVGGAYCVFHFSSVVGGYFLRNLIVGHCSLSRSKLLDDRIGSDVAVGVYGECSCSVVRGDIQFELQRQLSVIGQGYNSLLSGHPEK